MSNSTPKRKLSAKDSTPKVERIVRDNGKGKEEQKEVEKPPKLTKYRTCYRNTVYDVLRTRGWKESEDELDWDLMWADKEWMRDLFDHIHLADTQRVNHFPNHWEITRKDNLIKNLKRAKRQLEKEDKLAEAAKYSFFPTSYLLPSEYALFIEEWKKHPPGTFWIMKPVARAQGKGIFLFNKLNQIANWKKDYRSWNNEKKDENQPPAESYLVQSYIGNPYLVGGKKFDLRIYALVTSYSPLKVFVHRNAFARFSNHRYSMNLTDMSNNYVHLTNVAVQKTSKQYQAAGTKWPCKNFRVFMISKHGLEAVNQMFYEIQQVIVRTLIAAQRVLIHDKHCFEMYGYDILIDSNLKPWLLEVNASPSLSADTDEDHELKFGVLDDVLTMIDFDHKLKGNEEHVGGFDLVYDQSTGFKSTTSYLGCWVKKPAIGTYRTLGKGGHANKEVKNANDEKL